MNIAIRQEGPRDVARISEVVKLAFENVDYSDHCEHLMVDGLRRSRSYIPQLSVVAGVANVIVGHIMLTEVFFDP